MLCPCGLPLPYDYCCGRYHQGAPAPTAGALMRSRYTAYSMGLVNYIYETTAPRRRKKNGLREISAFANSCQFMCLELLSETELSVEFRAHYESEGEAYCLHELSDFIFENGCFYYDSGEVFSA